MHQPAAFVATNRQTLQQLVSAHPLATLIVESPDGVLVNHIPLLWNGGELHGHIARVNELVSVLQPTQGQPLRATAIFHGPEGYISPADYPSKLETGKVVPTWNYAVVHIHGTLQLREDPEWVRHQIDELTEKQERRAGEQTTGDAPLWSLDDAPAAFAQALTRNITGLVLNVQKTEGKFKLSQNRPVPDRQGASKGARSRGQNQLADWMEDINR